jgi:virginiamycin B lyase
MGAVTARDPATAATTVTAVSVGADGVLWFTLNRANAVGRLRPGGEPEIFPLPTPEAGPVGIAAAGDGAWFTEILAGRVGFVGVDGRITEAALPDPAARPHAVVTDGPGCWVTEWGTSRLAHVDEHGEVEHVDLPAGGEPHGLTRGPDGALWIALEDGRLARVAAA